MNRPLLVDEVHDRLLKIARVDDDDVRDGSLKGRRKLD